MHNVNNTSPQMANTVMDNATVSIALADTAEDKKSVTPVVKWVGGKRQLLANITAALPDSFSGYYEPFVGGGALLCHLQPERAVINDHNYELINLYQVIKDDVEELIADLAKHHNTPDYYYALRRLDRDRVVYEMLSNVERASRLLYLNKTCFNGLFRVNKAGEFNAPFGNYANPTIICAENLRAMHAYLNRAKVKLVSGDFADVMSRRDIPPGSFFYCDPPYVPVSDTANFTGYTPGGFTEADQWRLRECCDALDKAGHTFLLSNAAHPIISDLYHRYHIQKVRVKRWVSCKGDQRDAVDEVLIRNYRLKGDG